MDAYENRSVGSLFQGEAPKHLIFAISKLDIGVVPCCHLKVFARSEWRSTYSERTDHIMSQLQVVAYKTLKTMGNC